MGVVVENKEFHLPLLGYVYDRICDEISMVRNGVHTLCICKPHLIFPCNVDFCAGEGMEYVARPTNQFVTVAVTSLDSLDECVNLFKSLYNPPSDRFFITADMGTDTHFFMSFYMASSP